MSLCWPHQGVSSVPRNVGCKLRVKSCDCVCVCVPGLRVLNDILSRSSLAICVCVACIVAQFFCIFLLRRALCRHNLLHSSGSFGCWLRHLPLLLLLLPGFLPFQLTTFAGSPFAIAIIKQQVYRLLRLLVSHICFQPEQTFPCGNSTGQVNLN